MKIVLTFLLTLFSCVVFAQQRSLVEGKVVSRIKELENIYVSNLNTGESVMTAKGGYFKIKAQEADTLMFSSPFFIGYRQELDDIDFKRDIVLIPLEPNDLNRQLDEIYIQKITSESLGLVSSDIRRYTPAERRLYTATSGSGIIPVSAIVNWISGRTAMLKKALKYEKQEMRKTKFLEIISEEKLADHYMIPKDYVIGFAYFIADNDNMISYLNTSFVNKDKIETLTGELALEFLQIIDAKKE